MEVFEWKKRVFRGGFSDGGGGCSGGGSAKSGEWVMKWNLV